VAGLEGLQGSDGLGSYDTIEGSGILSLELEQEL
jgi:hypothetical protein